MSKSTAAIYAQKRRDNENQSRDALRALIPDRYFTKDLEDNGEFNGTSKVLLATRKYLEDIQPDDRASKDGGAHKESSKRETKDNRRFSLPEFTSSSGKASEPIRQLRQVATRLVQKVEEKLQAGDGLSKEVEDVIETTNDLIIDAIETIEKMP